VLQPPGEIAAGARQSPSCLEGDLYESGELLVSADSLHIRTPLLSLIAGIIYIYAHDGQEGENIQSVQLFASES
jgi:hypothetical protein